MRALSNALTQDRLHHAYLFTGTRGVGKTTIARIFAKSLNCEQGISAEPCGVCETCRAIDAGRYIDLIELDAASNTGVDNMRELLENALYAPTVGRYKVYIIDEVHMLSKGAFNAMLKTLEEPPGHVKFVLATTDPQKVPVTVLSRCLQFNLKQLPPQLILQHLHYVLEQEGVASDAGGLVLLARAAAGSMRDALSLTDQAIAFAAGKVDEAVVRAMLGVIDQGYLFDLLEALRAGDGAALLSIADQMQSRSLAFEAALQDLATLLHRLALVQTVPQAIPEDEPERARLFELAQQFSPEEVQLDYQIAIHGRNDIELAPDEYAGFTMTLLRMLAFRPSGAPAVARSAPVAAPRPAAVEAAPSRQLAAEPPAATRPATMEGTPDWLTLIGQLNLQAMALEMAKNCVLSGFDGNSLMLALSPSHKHLLTSKMAQDRLQAALNDYYGRPVRLQVTVGADAASVTPAVVEQQAKQARQQQAEESIRQDPFVREAQAQLGAQLIETSIKPLQQQ